MKVKKKKKQNANNLQRRGLQNILICHFFCIIPSFAQMKKQVNKLILLIHELILKTNNRLRKEKGKHINLFNKAKQ